MGLDGPCATLKMDFSLRYFRWELNVPRPEPAPPQPSIADRLLSPTFWSEIAVDHLRRERQVQQTVPQQSATEPSEASNVDVKTEGADSDYDFVDDFEAEAKMVQLVEVEDEHFQHAQEGPVEDDGDFTDTGTFLIALLCFAPALPARSPARLCAPCACDAIGQKIESITITGRTHSLCLPRQPHRIAPRCPTPIYLPEPPYPHALD